MAEAEITFKDREVTKGNEENFDLVDTDAQALQIAVDKIALAVDQADQGGQLEKMLTKLALQLDESKAFQAFQDFWNALPEKVQWTLLKAENYFPFLTIEYLNNLVQMGLLDFKGHQDQEIQIDQDAEAVLENKQKALDLLVKAKPEAKAAIPVLKQLAQLDQKKRDIFGRVRRAVVDEKKTKEAGIEQRSQSKMAV